MRWIKHLTGAHNDERMARLLHEAGAEGYGFYWLLVELVASTVEKDKYPSLTYPLTQWSHRLHSHPNRVSKYLGMLGVIGLVTTESREGCITVSIPNILKYKDEFTQRKPKNRELVPIDTCARSEREGELERELEKKQNCGAKAPGEPLVFEHKASKLPKQPSDWEVCALAAGRNIHGRHPIVRRDISENATVKKLRTIAVKCPIGERVSVIENIDRRHAGFCETHDWKKQNGEFAKGLSNWLAPTQDRYQREPPQSLNGQSDYDPFNPPIRQFVPPEPPED